MDNKSRLFYQIFRNAPLFRYILSFQKGLSFKDWVDGDLAAELGYLYLLQNNLNLKFSINAMDLAAGNGHLAVVQWFHNSSLDFPGSFAMDMAARNGHLEIVKYLHQKGHTCPQDTKSWAGAVMWLHETNSTSGLCWATKKGQLEVIKYLRENFLN